MKTVYETRKYCPHCNAHTPHKVKVASKGKASGFSFGNRKHARKLRGHGGKRAGQKEVKKQGKKQKLILTCTVCSKKQEWVCPKRTKKKIEVVKS